MEVVTEITERGVVKIKEKEMLAQIEKMAAIGQLAAGVAHELNTPLGTISIITDELERTLEATSGKKADGDAIRDYMNDLRGEITRCKDIIHDLLGFSKNKLSGFAENRHKHGRIEDHRLREKRKRLEEGRDNALPR